MRSDLEQFEWLDVHGTVGAPELARICNLTLPELDELVDYGLLTPVAASGPQRVFSAACVPSLREASALRSRFDLELFVLGLVFSQLQRISDLEREVRTLHAHLPHSLPGRDGPGSWREPHG